MNCCSYIEQYSSQKITNPEKITTFTISVNNPIINISCQFTEKAHETKVTQKHLLFSRLFPQKITIQSLYQVHSKKIRLDGMYTALLPLLLKIHTIRNLFQSFYTYLSAHTHCILHEKNLRDVGLIGRIKKGGRKPLVV